VDILSGCACTDDSYLQSYLSSWSSSFGAFPDTLPARQPFWDCPGIQVDCLLVESSLKLSFSAGLFSGSIVKAQRDWLYALPVMSCGMRLHDEAVRVTIGLQLGLKLCVSHQWHCEAQVDAFGCHAFVWKKAAGRSIRHHALNELVACAVSAAAIPNMKEPQGLCSDGEKA